MISVVVPIYNEDLLVLQLHAAIRDAMRSGREAWEVVYVNDGSSDGSLAQLRSLHDDDPEHVVVADLSRNWGHQAALTAGMSLAKGDAVILMDGDFQDPPSLLPALIAAWRGGAEVVIARRISRAETGIRRLLFPLFYKLLAFLSDYPIPLNSGIFGLMDRRVCDRLIALEETNRFLPGLRSWVGFRTEYVDFDRPERAAGKPKQTLWKLFKYAVDAVLSFSYKPLRVALIFGGSMAVLSVLAALVLITMRVAHVGIFRDTVVMGYTSLVCAVLFMGSVQLVCLGILGEYLGRVYDEVKRRPLYVIREVMRRTAEPAGRAYAARS